VQAQYGRSELRLRDAAQHAGLSPSYFSAMFAKYAGESFSDYLLRTRMKEAQMLLSNTDLRTYEIAYKVGYDNPTYFSTLFKRFAGMTVSQYREAFGPKFQRFV
jgi:two-component system response regulator YesN